MRATTSECKRNIPDPMANYKAKELPPLPEQADLSGKGKDRPPVARPLVLPRQSPKYQATADEMRRQLGQLQEQNKTLCQSLRASDEENIMLRKQITAYKQYIKKQDSGLAEVIKAICSAFQSYRETVVEVTKQATMSEEIAQCEMEAAGRLFPPQL